jgi:hypothetical protein
MGLADNSHMHPEYKARQSMDVMFSAAGCHTGGAAASGALASWLGPSWMGLATPPTEVVAA